MLTLKTVKLCNVLLFCLATPVQGMCANITQPCCYDSQIISRGSVSYNFIKSEVKITQGLNQLLMTNLHSVVHCLQEVYNFNDFLPGSEVAQGSVDGRPNKSRHDNCFTTATLSLATWRVASASSFPGAPFSQKNVRLDENRS